jgi:hypothetical protein
MSKHMGVSRVVLSLAVLIGLMLSATGCGYVKNVRDDLMDVGSFAIGYVPPVVKDDDGLKAVGFLPPCLGFYVEATDFLQFGYLFKATGDIEWDRRGLQTCVDIRRKVGFGPWHSVAIKQTPIYADAYKTLDSPMAAWREHMQALRDPVFDRPAKLLLFETEGVQDKDDSMENMTALDRHMRIRSGDRTRGEAAKDDAPKFEIPRLPGLYRGWQDWETFSVEIAVPEPLLLHSGFYLRAGVDPSQILDLALSLICIDLYSDRAYTFWGDYRFLTDAEIARRAAEAATETKDSPGMGSLILKDKPALLGDADGAAGSKSSLLD